MYLFHPHKSRFSEIVWRVKSSWVGFHELNSCQKNENLMKSSLLVFAIISDNWIQLPWDFWSQTEFWFFFSCHLILQLNMSTHEPPAVIRIRHKSNQSSSLRLWVWGILSWDARVSKFHGTLFCLTSVTQIISSYSNLVRNSSETHFI